MEKTYLAIGLVLIFLVAMTIYYVGIVLPSKPKLSYDFEWENIAQGTTYFCNQTKTSVTCSVMECYLLSGLEYSQNYCRNVGMPPLVFEKHD